MSTDGNVLLAIARAAIAHEFGHAQPVDDSAPWLLQPGACFVTLTRKQHLRGCIGSLQAERPLLDDVRKNALAAAFHDPRFDPLTEAEFAEIALEISLLSAIEPIRFTSEDDAIGQLQPHIDGVIFEYGHHRGTYLPQVWEKLSEPREFLTSLKYKAGLPPDFWDAEVKLARYAVTSWCESDSHRD